MTALARFAAGTYGKIKEVQSVEITPGNLVRVQLDFGLINTAVLERLDRYAQMQASFFPDSGVCIIPYDNNYITYFPFRSREAKLTGFRGGSGIVGTIPVDDRPPGGRGYGRRRACR